MATTAAEIQSELQLAVDRDRQVAEEQDAFVGRLPEMEQRLDSRAEQVERRVDEVTDGLGQSADSLQPTDRPGCSS